MKQYFKQIPFLFEDGKEALIIITKKEKPNNTCDLSAGIYHDGEPMKLDADKIHFAIMSYLLHSSQLRERLDIQELDKEPKLTLVPDE